MTGKLEKYFVDPAIELDKWGRPIDRIQIVTSMKWVATIVVNGFRVVFYRKLHRRSGIIVSIGKESSVSFRHINYYNMTKENIAQVCHEINKAYCESIGDPSQPSWEEAPEWQRSSAIKGVEFHLDNPDAPPSSSHESWLKQKTEEGWKYGPVKDAEKKEHPCYVPYDQLPVEQQSKDFLFKQTVHSLKQFLN